MTGADHIGAIVHDTADRALHGVSWGSRHFYRWPIRRNGTVTNTGAPPTPVRTLNRSHYVDYQDCHYVGNRQMLCSGVSELRQKPGSAPFRLGGLELVDLRDDTPFVRLGGAFHATFAIPAKSIREGLGPEPRGARSPRR